jgi:hypothetical protein
MQPYFLPYIGYFQLIHAVDLFILYDNIEYTKAGWINRNRLCRNGEAVTFSLPLSADSDHLHVGERRLAPNFRPEKILNQFKGAYSKAPFFSSTLPLLEGILYFEARNLFTFLHHALLRVCGHLKLRTEVRLSSSIPIDHGLKSVAKVLAICEAVKATQYINSIGGTALYSAEAFAARHIELFFLQGTAVRYSQFNREFVPMLSIIDVLMFNSLESVGSLIESGYELVRAALPARAQIGR